MDWLWTILGGLLVGVLARIFVRGRQNFGIIVTILLGIAGAAIGHWVWYTVLNREDTAGVNWIQFFISIAAAAILIGIWGALFSKKK